MKNKESIAEEKIIIICSYLKEFEVYERVAIKSESVFQVLKV